MGKSSQANTDITSDLLLQAYAVGVFPMAESRHGELRWVDPDRRGILPLDSFHLSRTNRRVIRRGGYRVTVNRAFREVLRGCAARPETWINAEIARLYIELHERGFAHSVEVWDARDDALFGGIYGVSLGAAFFGESMFSAKTNGSKIALTFLMARLNAGGYALMDTQFVTSHLASFGAVEISRSEYRARLAHAIRTQSDWSVLPEDASPDDAVHLSTQTS
ncbi:MAG: leucyl/phenylalanyl-tRNA--protein transferase [Pseudomonadota bacterium]